jgi:hypothetical protein
VVLIASDATPVPLRTGVARRPPFFFWSKLVETARKNRASPVSLSPGALEPRFPQAEGLKDSSRRSKRSEDLRFSYRKPSRTPSRECQKPSRPRIASPARKVTPSIPSIPSTVSTLSMRPFPLHYTLSIFDYSLNDRRLPNQKVSKKKRIFLDQAGHSRRSLHRIFPRKKPAPQII